MSPLDHLSPADRLQYLDRLAYHHAQLQIKEQAKTTLYKGQAAIATALGRSRATVAKLMEEGRLQYSRHGKKGYCVTQEQLTNYLQNS